MGDSAKVETVAETVPAAAPAAAPAAEENADGKDKIPILDKVYEKFDDMNLNEELLRYVKSPRFLDLLAAPVFLEDVGSLRERPAADCCVLFARGEQGFDNIERT
mmetsp:Transcript_14359/g.58089  ORF Transcript_14359/g.58089 Transcript_14359/m.58089 type:complete len:105 (-) Transcript_14359:3487-3801(-)